MKTTQRGFIVSLLLVIIALLLAGGGAYVYTQTKQANSLVVENVPVVTSTLPVSSTANNPEIKPLVVDPKTVKIGNVFGNWTVSSINDLSFYSDGSPSSGSITFAGDIIIAGEINETVGEQAGGLLFIPTIESGTQIPVFKEYNFTNHFGLIGDHKIIPTGKVSIEVKNFSVSFYGKGGSAINAEFVRYIGK